VSQVKQDASNGFIACIDSKTKCCSAAFRNGF
jgi:hypothetical protein